MKRFNGRKQLCICSPYFGIGSETYIRKHLCELLPGKTVGIAFRQLPVERQTWKSEQPTLCVESPPWLGHTVRNLCWAISRQTGGALDRSRIAYFLMQHQVGAVLAEYLPVAVELLPICKKLGIPLWAHAHGNDVSGLIRQPDVLQAYSALNGAAGVIVVSNTMRNTVLALGMTAAPIHVIPCGVYSNDARVEAIPSKGACLRVTFVGRLIGKKSPIFLLDSFRRALEKRSQMHLNVVGDGDLMAAARHFATLHNIEKDVTFHGSLPPGRIVEVLRETGIYMQHSCIDPVTGDSEGLPVSILEAMAEGLPVIATHHAGIAEAVVDGASGYLVQPGDTIGMADCLIRLADDADLRSCFGRNGREIVKAKFSWEMEKQKLLSVLGW